MNSPHRTSALLVCGLSLVFSYAFFLLKHHPAFRDIIPFADDPYDAVGSFALIAANFLAAISLARVFLPQFVGRTASSLYISRTQAAVALCILMTVSTDATAMLRHVPKWKGAPGAPAMLAILLCLSAASLAMLLSICRSSRPPNPSRWTIAFAVFVGALLCLRFYPEALGDSILTHLVTIDFAGLLLFAPVTCFVMVLLPGEPSTLTLPPASRRPPAVPRWTIVALLGLSVGLAAFAAEVREPGSVPAGRFILVGSVYGYCGLSSLLIAYTFLRKPLGFLSAD
jgi:hypothetical protein